MQIIDCSFAENSFLSLSDFHEDHSFGRFGLSFEIYAPTVKQCNTSFELLQTAVRYANVPRLVS